MICWSIVLKFLGDPKRLEEISRTPNIAQITESEGLGAVYELVGNVNAVMQQTGHVLNWPPQYATFLSWDVYWEDPHTNCLLPLVIAVLASTIVWGTTNWPGNFSWSAKSVVECDFLINCQKIRERIYSKFEVTTQYSVIFNNFTLMISLVRYQQ